MIPTPTMSPNNSNTKHTCIAFTTTKGQHNPFMNITHQNNHSQLASINKMYYYLPSKTKLSKPTTFLLSTAMMAMTTFSITAVDPISATGKEPIIELFMHDILGGSNPTARPVTGLLGNIYSGQVPFATPVGFNTPSNSIPIPNANGAIPTVNGVTGIPLGTGLSGTSFAPNSNNQNQNNAQLLLGPDGLGLGFGTITVIDDILTSQPELGSQIVGKAQGVYVASSADGSRQMMVLTAVFEGGEYGDSLNLYGLYKIGSSMSRLSVIGGTGKFKVAKGFAELRPLIPPGQIATDGAETLLRITIHLNY